jgi:hypothetical protein
VNKKITSLIIISMMMVVALGVVFADNGDKEGCPCNPLPPVSKIKETENTEGDVQHLGECMRYRIEYRNCTPKQWTWEVVKCVLIKAWWGGRTSKVWCKGTWTQQCDKYGVWYDNCTHQKLYEDYLGRVTLSGSETHSHYWDCSCP